MSHEHITVLSQEAVSGLNLKEGETAIDATLGLGGHSELLTEVVGKKGNVLGIDADENALEYAKERLKRASHMQYALGNFRDIDKHIEASGLKTVNGVLFDLGWNTTQLKSGRGFSFNSNEPLLMTFARDPEEEVTAETIVNEWSERDLAEMIKTLGEERYAPRIAEAITRTRKEERITTAGQLAQVVNAAVPASYRRGRVHPATKTFQAVRMMVNDELSTIQEALPKALELVVPGGRIAVITFHSLEDGLVKRIFKAFEKDGTAERVTKKPIVPGREEVKDNPRARSAKLRIIEKL